MTINYNQLGTVSAGTLRDADLAPAFYDFAVSIDAYVGATEEAAVQAVVAGTYEDGDPAEVIAGLIDAINDALPSYLYFGAHEGDGADFGVWAVDWVMDRNDDTLLRALLDVDEAAEGDSNDGEIEALRMALDIALETLRAYR